MASVSLTGRAERVATATQWGPQALGDLVGLGDVQAIMAVLQSETGRDFHEYQTAGIR